MNSLSHLISRIADTIHFNESLLITYAGKHISVLGIPQTEVIDRLSYRFNPFFKLSSSVKGSRLRNKHNLVYIDFQTSKQLLEEIGSICAFGGTEVEFMNMPRSGGTSIITTPFFCKTKIKKGWAFAYNPTQKFIKGTPNSRLAYVIDRLGPFYAIRNLSTGSVLLNNKVGEQNYWWVIQPDEDLFFVDMRLLIQDLFKIMTCQDNFIWLHCAALCGNGKKILLIGSKGAGKTVAVLRLCKNRKYNYISNDGVMLGSHRGTVIAYGWPAGIRIPNDMLEALQISTTGEEDTGKTEYELAELKTNLDINCVTTLLPDTIIFIDKDLGCRIEPVREKEFFDYLLTEVIYTPLNCLNLLGMHLPDENAYGERVLMIAQNLYKQSTSYRAGREYLWDLI